MAQASQFPALVCNQCGSKLIEIKTKVEKTSAQQSPITTTSYKCSNKECQANIDKKMKEAREKRKQLEAAEAARIAKRNEKQTAPAPEADEEIPAEILAEVEAETKAEEKTAS